MIKRKVGYHVVVNEIKRLNKCLSNKRATQLADKARSKGFNVVLIFDSLELTEEALLKKHFSVKTVKV